MVFYVITTTSLNYMFIRHKAILYNDGRQDMVLHHNEDGVFLQPLKSFMSGGRQLLSSEAHECDSISQITNYYVEHAEDRFNLFTNNCEQFVNRFLSQLGETIVVKSPQLALFILVTLASLGATIYTLFKKRIITKEKCEYVLRKLKSGLS